MTSAWQMDSETKFYGVLGDPVRHSKSPIMMNRAFRACGINAAYGAFHVTPERLKDAVRGLRALGFRGFNVTIPHKVDVMDHLDAVDERARRIGAVNTVVADDNGVLTGYNTDGIGYVRSLKEETGIALEGKRVALIGAGGAARGIVFALAEEGVASVAVLNRTESSARSLAAEAARFVSCEGMPLNALADIIDQIDLLINTTSVGMHPNVDDVPVPPELLRPHLVVSDIVYNPRNTRLLREAAAKGCPVHGGLGMFIYQGAYAFEYWTGTAAPVAVMREAVEASLR